jgi:hypothetical protein
MNNKINSIDEKIIKDKRRNLKLEKIILKISII